MLFRVFGSSCEPGQLSLRWVRELVEGVDRSMNFREVLFDSQSKTDFSIISLVIKQKCFSRNMIIYKMHLQKNKNSGK